MATRMFYVLRECHRPVSRVHTGVTWKCVIASAPWAARSGHTTVIDDAGAIYVLGGYGGGWTKYNDVWVSTDGGVRPDSVRGTRGCCGYLRGTKRVL
jgi:hypothetical protein